MVRVGAASDEAARHPAGAAVDIDVAPGAPRRADIDEVAAREAIDDPAAVTGAGMHGGSYRYIGLLVSARAPRRLPRPLTRSAARQSRHVARLCTAHRHCARSRPRADIDRIWVKGSLTEGLRQRMRDSMAGVAVTPCSVRSRSASSGMVTSGVASTAAIRKSATGSSLPLPLGRPWRAGAAELVREGRHASLIAQLALTENCRAAARREPPFSTNPVIRSRRS